MITCFNFFFTIFYHVNCPEKPIGSVVCMFIAHVCIHKLERGASFLNQSQNLVKQNQSKCNNFPLQKLMREWYECVIMRSFG